MQSDPANVAKFFEQVHHDHPGAEAALREYYGYGAMRPVFDKAHQDGYYVCNCKTGTAYSDMYFAKIDLDGREQARHKTNNAVRCLQLIGDDQVLIALDKKYILLRAADLSLVEIYDKSVPAYSDQILLTGDKIYSVGLTSHQLRVYDTASQRATILDLPGVPEPDYSKSLHPDKAIQPVMTQQDDLLIITTKHPARQLTFDTRSGKFD